MFVKYVKIDIQKTLDLLNSVEVKGLDNCRRLLMIEQVLQHPKGEEQNGTDD